jgi:hypothetical protein
MQAGLAPILVALIAQEQRTLVAGYAPITANCCSKFPIQAPLKAYRQGLRVVSRSPVYAFWRKAVGETPVQRLNARVKLLVSVKPSVKAISVIARDDCCI